MNNPLAPYESYFAVESTDPSIMFAWHEQFEIWTIIHYGGATIYHVNPAGAWYVPPFYPAKEAVDA